MVTPACCWRTLTSAFCAASIACRPWRRHPGGHRGEHLRGHVGEALGNFDAQRAARQLFGRRARREIRVIQIALRRAVFLHHAEQAVMVGDEPSPVSAMKAPEQPPTLTAPESSPVPRLASQSADGGSMSPCCLSHLGLISRTWPGVHLPSSARRARQRRE